MKSVAEVYAYLYELYMYMCECNYLFCVWQMTGVSGHCGITVWGNVGKACKRSAHVFIWVR